LKHVLADRQVGQLFLEFFIPRMGKRADAVFVSGNTIYVIEFKVGAKEFDRGAIDQVHDYALDLKNFHLGSHDLPIVPILVATKASHAPAPLAWAADSVAEPVLAGVRGSGQHWHSKAYGAAIRAPCRPIDLVPDSPRSDCMRKTSGLGSVKHSANRAQRNLWLHVNPA